MLRDYRPKSIYKIPVTEIAKARFPIIDMHSHPYAKTPEQIAEWVGNVDEVGVEKTIILTAAVGTSLTLFIVSTPSIPIVSKYGAVLTFPAMTGRGSAPPLSRN